MTHTEALGVFKKKYPKLTITDMFDYSDEYYIITAVSGKGNDFDDPFYAVNKNTSEILRYHPMSDFSNFVDARANRRIDLKA